MHLEPYAPPPLPLITAPEPIASVATASVATAITTTSVALPLPPPLPPSPPPLSPPPPPPTSRPPQSPPLESLPPSPPPTSPPPTPPAPSSPPPWHRHIAIDAASLATAADGLHQSAQQLQHSRNRQHYRRIGAERGGARHLREGRGARLHLVHRDRATKFAEVIDKEEVCV